MKEGLIQLTSQDVKEGMRKIEPKDSYSNEVAKDLSETCIGQEEAMESLARAITLAEAGMNDPDRPLRVLMFSGKTGTGKTEASHAVAKHWFNDRNSEQLKIIDCTEYSERHMVTRLTGAPPSYVGYNDDPVITPEFLANRNIIVLDEFEKAHPNFHKIWLGVFEDARMSVQKGDKLNFNNSLIILTSNAGAEEMQKATAGTLHMGFSADKETAEIDKIGQKAIKDRFSDMPELLGRIDDLIIFKDLQPEHYSQIFDKFLMEKNRTLIERLHLNAPFFAATTEFKSYILDNLDTTYGARDLRGALERELFHKAADLFMQEDLTGRPLVADRENEETVFYTDMLVSLENPYLDEIKLPKETELVPDVETPLQVPPKTINEVKEPPIRTSHKKRKYTKQPRPRNEMVKLDYSIFQQ